MIKAAQTELVNFSALSGGEKDAVVASLLRYLDLRAVRFTDAEGKYYFGVVSDYDAKTAVPPVRWADGHMPRTT